MATTTTNLGLSKPAVNGDANLWGGYLNGNADLLDAIFTPGGTGTSVGLNIGSGNTLAIGGTLSVASGATSTFNGKVGVGGAITGPGNFSVHQATNVNLIVQTGTVDATGLMLSAANDAYSAIVPLQFRGSYLNFTNGLGEVGRFDTNGYLLVGYTTSNGAYKLQVNSQIFATSSTIATSDANYKTNVTPLTGALDMVNALNPVSFSWKPHAVHAFDTTKPTVGFLAQEVKSALGELPFVDSIVKQSVCTLPDGSQEPFLGIAEGNMVAILAAAVKELTAKLKAAGVSGF